MRYIALLFCLLAFQVLSAQTTETQTQVVPTASAPRPIPAQAAVEDKTLTLQERYLIMKTKSQTFNDYKVIKEVVLDGVWKITRDSIATRKAMLAKANANIADLKTQVDSSKSALVQKEASMQDVLYDSTHISVLGIPMGKSFFIGAVAGLLAVLILALVLVSGKLKLMYSSQNEKSELALAIHSEFEEYKRKALDKQTKLSRELQNERNKLAEIRR